MGPMDWRVLRDLTLVSGLGGDGGRGGGCNSIALFILVGEKDGNDG